MTTVGEVLEELDKEFKKYDRKVDLVSFSVDDIKVLKVYQEPIVQGNSLIWGDRSAKDGGALLKYMMHSENQGKISLRDYFNNHLMPLLNKYDPRGDHSQIWQHLAYLEHLMTAIPVIHTTITSRLSAIKRAIDSPEKFCEITSPETIESLPIEDKVKRCITGVKVWAPALPEQYIVLKNREDSRLYQPVFNRHNISQHLKTGRSNFDMAVLRLVLEYRNIRAN